MVSRRNINLRTDLLEKLIRARYRRRTIANLDNPVRGWLRALERRLKFALSSPLGALLRPRRLTVPLPPSSIRNILLLRYDAIGDAILTTPIWRSLKKYAPQVHIGVVGSLRNEAFLKDDKDIDDVFVFSRVLNMRNLRDLFRARKTNWDLVLNFYYHDKTGGAIYARVVAPKAYRATLTHRNIEKYEQIYSIVGQRSSTQPMKPVAEQNLDLLQLTVNIPLAAKDRIPSLKPKDAVASHITETIASTLRARNATEYVILNTDASQIYKEWGFQNSLGLTKRIIAANPNMMVFWTSAPDRREPAEAALGAAGIPRTEMLATPSLTDLVAAIKGARAIITPDTSVVHFAMCLNVPVLAFYLFESEYPPIGGVSEVLYPDDRRNVATIPVDTAYSSFERLLHRSAHQSKANATANLQ